MPGKWSRSQPIRYVGVAFAIVAVVGFAAFGWRFGETDGAIPTALGVAAVAIAVGVELYRRA